MITKRSKPVLVQELRQKDNFTFTIKWSDGVVNDYRLSDVQAHCPCAHCVDEASGKRLIDQKSIEQDVRAVRISNVGRYALRIQFTSGCSTGIYSFEMLCNLARRQA